MDPNNPSDSQVILLLAIVAAALILIGILRSSSNYDSPNLDDYRDQDALEERYYQNIVR